MNWISLFDYYFPAVKYLLFSWWWSDKQMWFNGVKIIIIQTNSTVNTALFPLKREAEKVVKKSWTTPAVHLPSPEIGEFFQLNV